MTPRKRAFPGILALVLSISFSTAASPQQQKSASEHSADNIVSDNLGRVAASAEQILEVLRKDSGLMVEFKRMLAEDAGKSGQILEEQDLNDEALNERLHQDLRTRVLTTRLLRHYGYLQPQFNPGSDSAAEHSVMLREKANSIERASEHDTAIQETQRTERSAASCEVARSADCPAPQPPLEQRMELPADRQPKPRRSSPVTLTNVDEVRDTAVPDLLTDPMEAGATLTKTSLRPPGPLPSAALGESFAPEQPAKEVLPAADLSVPVPLRPLRVRTTRPAADSEPVRMERRPSPYADVPSLYDLYVQAATPNRKMERFGLDIFRNGSGNPDILPMDLPVGPDYVVGPGDSLSINLWGGVSERIFRTVDREGRVALPEAGPVLVSGRTLGDLQQEVQRVLRTQFRDISADVSLLRLRTVRAYVVGDVAEPGAYDISSLSTPLNALFAAGGVTPQGSMRRIQHYRGKQLIEEVDAYDLLLHGVRGDLKRLENGDSLLVPPLGPVVTVEGMVRRAALYELRGEKNLEDVLDLAGGILPAAALQHIEVQRLVAHDKRTMLSLEVGETSDPEALRKDLEKFAIQDGDEVHIFPIAPYNESALYLQGHVLRPGRYSYHDGIKLGDVISSYKDLLPEPAAHYAEIIRITAPDYRPVVHGFDLAAALAHPENAPKLEPLDTVRIFGRYDLEPIPEVFVTGEVNAPGNYRTSGEQHFRDAVYQAGGVTPEAWLDTAQLFRAMPDGSEKVFNISLRDALAGDPLNNVPIEPRDHILIHRQPEKVSPSTVYVRGDVARPGRYPLVANMRVSDLLRSAGGLLRSANAEGGDLTHYALSAAGANQTQASGEEKVNLAAALQGNGDEDFPLRDGDVLTVPQQGRWKDIGASVTIRGEVGKPGVYGIQPGERLSSLLRRAGGLLSTAYPQAAVFQRISVYELQQKSRQELIQRIEQESPVVKSSINATGTEEAALHQEATQQRQRVLEALRNAPISGRLVIHLRSEQKSFEGSPDDIELRAGDSLEIPKQPGFVLTIGQVYNSNAITYTPGKNVSWYLSRAGGATGLANKGAIFILRANGSVTSGSSGLWSKGALSAGIGPGDTVVVPERTTVGGNAWKNLVAIAQIAQAGALAAAVAIP